MKKLLAIAFVVIFFASLGVVSVGTCSFFWGAGYFEVISNNGTRVFRHESFGWEMEEYIPPLSAVFTNTEPRELVFNVDIRYVYATELLFSDDMTYIIFIPSWPTRILTFLIEGNRIASFNRTDFIRRYDVFYRQPEHACDRPYRHTWNISNFSPETYELTITTTEISTFVIDIRTGEIISESWGANYLLIFAIGAVSAVTFATVLSVIKISKNKSKNGEPS